MASSLPSTLNDNLGSNYGLDGFPGVDYGKGIRDRPGLTPQPPVSDVSHLPGDVVGNSLAPLDIDMSNESTAFDFPIDLQGSDVGLRDGQDVVHHEWLQAGQDPARLPHLNKEVLGELSALWGGITTGPGARQGALRELMRVAMRRSAQGESLTTIRTKLEGLVRESWTKIEPAFNRLAAEHGLHGNVYLRASAFPGLHRGKHANLLRKLAGRARYLVGGDAEGAAALGLQSISNVHQIPWAQELKHYASKLSVLGRQVKLGGDPKETLRQAFLGGTEVRVAAPSFPQARARPMAEAPTPAPARPQVNRELQLQWARLGTVADRLVKVGMLSPDRLVELRRAPTPDAFRQALTAEALRPKPQATFQGQRLTAAPIQPVAQALPVVPIEQLVAARAAHRARLRVEGLANKLARQGAVTTEQAGALSKMGSVVEVRAVARAQDKAPKGHYSGGYHLDQHKRQAVFDTQKSQAEEVRAREQEHQQAVARLRAKVARLQKGATHGEDLQLLIPRLFTATEKRQAQRAIDLILSRTQISTPAPEASAYGGKVYTAHQSSGAAAYNSHTLGTAQRWLQQQLHQGEGAFVQQELGRRFASVAQDPSLTQIRTKHAGKAGKVYIDAAAFASPTGIAGCEQGASLLRTASAKYVISMSRCQGCSFRNVHGDCRKYRRPMVASIEEVPGQ